MSKKLVDKLFVYVVEDPDDIYAEGIPAVSGLGGMMFPLVGADIDRAKSFEQFAEELVRVKKKRVELRLFEGPYKVLKSWEAPNG